MRAFLADDRGISAVEYILVASLSVLVLFGILHTIFVNLQEKYVAVNNGL